MKLTILILSTSPHSEATQLFFKAAAKRGHNPVIKNPNNLYLFVSDSENGFDRIYDGSGEMAERLVARNYDAIIPRIHSDVNFGVPLVRHFNQNLGIFSTQSASGIRAASNKFETHQKLSIAGIKTPKTIFAKSPKHIKFLIEKIGDLPAIAKTVKGSLGLGVMILKDVEQTNSTMEALYHNQVETLLQAFIDGKAKDIRAIVVGNEVVASMERTGKKGDFRANVSRGGTGMKIELSEADKELCIKAAKSINLSVAGVDLIKDAEGNSYIIEINAAFGMQIQEITGIDIAGKIIEYIEKNHKQKTTGTSANANGASAASAAPKEDKRTFWEVLSSLRAEKSL
ncbi:MAG: RimK family alpha-L-glutamate ligase [Bacteroidetes bacterium]|nr:RimK family alpha-L-glutamate ligase [Bacteroidota bacterium]